MINLLWIKDAFFTDETERGPLWNVSLKQTPLEKRADEKPSDYGGSEIAAFTKYCINLLVLGFLRNEYFMLYLKKALALLILGKL